MNMEKYFTHFYSVLSQHARLTISLHSIAARHLFLLSANTKIASCHELSLDPCNVIGTFTFFELKTRQKMCMEPEILFQDYIQVN